VISIYVFLWISLGGVIAFIGLCERLMSSDWKKKGTVYDEDRNNRKVGGKMFVAGLLLPLTVVYGVYWFLFRSGFFSGLIQDAFGDGK